MNNIEFLLRKKRQLKSCNKVNKLINRKIRINKIRIDESIIVFFVLFVIISFFCLLITNKTDIPIEIINAFHIKTMSFLFLITMFKSFKIRSVNKKVEKRFLYIDKKIKALEKETAITSSNYKLYLDEIKTLNSYEINKLPKYLISKVIEENRKDKNNCLCSNLEQLKNEKIMEADIVLIENN